MKVSFINRLVVKNNLLLALLVGGVIGYCVTGCSSPRSAVASKVTSDSAIVLPLGGNGWNTGSRRGGRITNDGIRYWRNADAVFTTYIRLGQTGHLKVWLDGDVPSGQSELRVTIGKQSRTVKLESSLAGDPVFAGSWNIKDTGYVAIELKGISKTGSVYADLNNLLLKGKATEGTTAYTKNNKGNFFHWGRRGPSVHLNYSLPKDEQAEWFYNEVTVPEGEDVLGSYYMADGFSSGYFGMQVNSPTVRHILFSVWSPYDTNRPDDIPEVGS